jgi:23S rRNA-/tRNA-specific pseudouridylate synthase
MLRMVEKQFGKYSPVHRLGRGTSGVILWAKTKQAKSFLGKAIIDHKVKKVYLALVQGIEMPDSFSITQAIGPVSYPALRQTKTIHAACPEREGGRPAVSHCWVVHRYSQQNQTLLKVRIETGRPHQIRIHVAFAGYPLVGDPLYTIGGQPKKSVLEGEEERSSNERVSSEKEHEKRYLDELKQTATDQSEEEEGEDADGGGGGSGRNALPGDLGYLLHSWKFIFEHPTSRQEKVRIVCSPPEALWHPSLQKTKTQPNVLAD